MNKEEKNQKLFNDLTKLLTDSVESFKNVDDFMESLIPIISFLLGNGIAGLTDDKEAFKAIMKEVFDASFKGFEEANKYFEEKE